jgi:hypothetical protein
MPHESVLTHAAGVHNVCTCLVLRTVPSDMFDPYYWGSLHFEPRSK